MQGFARASHPGDIADLPIEATREFLRRHAPFDRMRDERSRSPSRA